MAANDQYYNSSHANPYHDTYSDARGTPWPPYSSHSPFDEPAATPYTPFPGATPAPSYHTSTPAYPGASGRLQDERDPFDDTNAIPLNGRKQKHESTQTLAPILPQQEQDDPFVRDVDPNKQRRQPNRLNGWFSGKVTWMVYVLTFAQLVVFLAEIIRMAVLTGTPIEIHPSFNPMIGPSPYVLINMGARYQPCMHAMPGVQDSSVPISWPCPNATATTGNSVTCQLSDLCGFNPDRNPQVNGNLDDTPAPDQWWRFIVPMFIHAGVVHIGFNLLLQLTLAREVEKLIGSIRFALVYFASGIFGFVLGGNFAATGIESCGCSGSLFGVVAITLLDLLYNWRDRQSPVRDLLFIFIDMAIAFVLGLLPGLDNFSHIGGFMAGLVLGVCLLHSPNAVARRTAQQYAGTDYAHIARREKNRGQGLRSFVKDPAGFFKDRRPVWWAWWLLRAATLIAVLIGFILLLKNFYQWRHGCHWCKYLSCLPIKVGSTNWCDVGNLNFSPTGGNQTSKRHLLELTKMVFEPNLL